MTGGAAKAQVDGAASKKGAKKGPRAPAGSGSTGGSRTGPRIRSMRSPGSADRASSPTPTARSSSRWKGPRSPPAGRN